MTARGAGGRFAKAAAPEPAAGPATPADVYATAAPRPPLIALRVEPIDAGPRELDDLPPPEPSPAATADGSAIAPDDTDARSLVAVALDGLDGLVGVALGGDFRADPDRLDELKAAAVPVAVRLGSLVGAGDVATRTLPEWALELVRLAARSWVAYSDAIVEAWQVAAAARRAELEDDDDASDGQAGGGRGGGRGGARRDPAPGAGSGAAPGGPLGAPGAPAGAARSGGDGPGYGDRLAAALARAGGG